MQVCAPPDDKECETEQLWFERAGIWALEDSVTTGPCMWLRFCTTVPVGEPHSPLICISCMPAREDLRSAATFMPRIRDEKHGDITRLDYVEIRKWLQHCSTAHNVQCHLSTTFKRRILNLRLINVRTRTIEHVHDEKPYMALSYVWGPAHGQYSLRFWQNCVDDEKDGIKLPDSLPKQSKTP